MAGWRNIVVEGLRYRWRGGRSGHLTVRAPDGRGYNAPLPEVCGPGWNWDTIERGQWKRYFALKPCVVERYIRRVILMENLPPPPYSWSTP